MYAHSAREKFTKEGDLTDAVTLALLGRWFDDYEEFARATLARVLPSLNRKYLTTRVPAARLASARRTAYL